MDPSVRCARTEIGVAASLLTTRLRFPGMHDGAGRRLLFSRGLLLLSELGLGLSPVFLRPGWAAKEPMVFVRLSSQAHRKWRCSRRLIPQDAQTEIENALGDNENMHQLV